MVPRVDMIFNAILFAVGVYWCYEVIGRWRSDLDELRTVDDKLRRAVIVGFWILTAAIAVLVVTSALRVIFTIVGGIRKLM